jgi:cyclopropane-fatty-acyl-phospholipid synthase
MNESFIYTGKVMHARLWPTQHEFQYPIYFYALNLDELPHLGQKLGNFVFGYNKKALVSVWDKDYLSRDSGSIRQKLESYLEKNGCSEKLGSIFLITSARFLNYVFNPVSFYYCYNIQGELAYVVAEVNNTFHERHLYILHAPQSAPKGFEARYTVPKEFHVSPFNDMKGDYDFFFSALNDTLDVRIDIVRDGNVVFRSRQWGSGSVLNLGSLWKVLSRYPFSALLTMPRILWQAGLLYFKRRLPVFHKPSPKSDLTIRVKPASFLQRLARSVVLKSLNGLSKGRLEVFLPEGESVVCEGQEPGTSATIKIREWSFFSKVLASGGVGLGETFQQGLWESDNPAAVLKVFIENRAHLEYLNKRFSWPVRALNRLKHTLQRNSKRGSSKNIQAHYDLSNDFFRLFLDKSMTYSCAIFKSPKDSLEEAQMHKIDAMISKARIDANCHVLEIGSGWGTLAIEVAKRTGCKVTTITLSKEQLAYVRDRIQQEGLEHRVQVKLCDYRDVRGSFDRVLSVEMLEAVGHEYLGTFYAAIERVLKPNGIAVIQVITMPDHRYETYRRGCDWIQKYIFPGSLLPSLTALGEAATSNSHLLLEAVENIGPHYAHTLLEWRRRFMLGKLNVERIGFDLYFQKTWEYYLAYCEAAFATRTLNVLQLVYSREACQTLLEEDKALIPHGLAEVREFSKRA